MGNNPPNIAVTCGDVFTDEVLTELGLSGAEIAELRNGSIVA